MKEYKKLIIGIIIGGIIASSVTAYAYSYLASDVKYKNDASVSDALDDLYNKTKNYIKPEGEKEITISNNGTIIENVSEYSTAKISVNVTNGIDYFYNTDFNSSGVHTVGTLNFTPKYVIATWTTNAGTGKNQMFSVVLDIENNTGITKWTDTSGVTYKQTTSAIGSATQVNDYKWLQLSSSNVLTLYTTAGTQDLRILAY